jgi:hypothetical protein
MLIHKPRWRKARLARAADRESTLYGGYSPVRYTCRRHRGTRDILDAPGCLDSQRHVPTVTIIDPCHPLYGRTFRVAVQHPTLREPLFFEVEHRDGIILRIAAAATDYAYCPSSSPRTKITPDAIRVLLGFVADWRDPCVLHPATSGDGSPKRSADPSARKS